MRTWLIKSEPDAYSIDDLQAEGTACWDGIRNYQARNFMRDEMSVGDLVLFYHSNVNPPGVVGIARVCSQPYPDYTAWDPSTKYYDPKSTAEKPVWMMVDIHFVEKFERILSLHELRERGDLTGMLLLKKGMRLSIQPVEQEHFNAIVALGKGESIS